MSYRAMYAYAWDLAERDLGAVADEVRGLGLDTITLATSYHAGKFLRPRGKTGKVYFPEDGTAYYRPDPSRYAALKPVENSLLATRDILAELCALDSVATNAWLVLTHNSRLGMLHPESCVRNAFGDRLIYNLCPSAPEVRAYAVALCTDVTENYPVVGISLETPGFLPSVHGYHHEFALVRQNRWLDNNMGLCFCDHCLKGARAAGIDAEGLRTQVAADVTSCLDGDFDMPDDMAEAFWLADTRTDGEMAAFLAWRCDVVTTLVAEIRAAVRDDARVAIIPSVARPSGGAWYEGSDLKALTQAAGILEACFYEGSVDRVKADAWDVQRRLRGVGSLRGILRPGFPDLQTAGDVAGAVNALRAAGIEDIAFYNYGHLRQRSIDWIGAAMRQSGS
ncbi:MAG: hypothetical protein KDJ86_08510 [Bauldia sp.]|uniref:hypothetical protein n=1 Tax=Bauldia sp. TaxID=2575872 RepID=UPI001D3781C9|nr:hypothetical protein [Bauldia sp.]MCB1495812.1 hypothetical protein [Bauldia sp.]